MTQQEIGNSIKERRKKLGINQQTLADLSGVAVNTVVAIERGEGNPQLATLLTILDTLGLQIDINIKQLAFCKRQMPRNMCSPMKRTTTVNPSAWQCLSGKSRIAQLIFSPISIICCLKVPTVKCSQCCFISMKTMILVLCLQPHSMMPLDP